MSAPEDELWTVESDAVSSVEAPEEHRHEQHGRVLGQG